MSGKNDNTINPDRLALFASFLSLVSSVIFFIVAVEVVRRNQDMEEIEIIGDTSA